MIELIKKLFRRETPDEMRKRIFRQNRDHNLRKLKSNWFTQGHDKL